jgi:single-strand DNA-binding protein
MSSLNKVQLIGNLGRDPEARTTQDGRVVVTLNLATTEVWKDRTTGEKRDKTEWHRVVIFQDRATDACQKYLRKGSKVYVEGALQTRKWTDQSGADRYSTEIVVQQFGGTVTFLDGKRSDGGDYAPGSEPVGADLSDEIPF